MDARSEALTLSTLLHDGWMCGQSTHLATTLCITLE